MKKIFIQLAAAFAVCNLTSCEDKFTETFTANVPVYKSWEQWRSESMEMQSPSAIEEAGKIYLYKQYLLINDRQRGIHIYDNSDPSNPAPLGFLPILGNVDMAVRNDVLMADAFTDLLAFDISNISSPQLICRTVDAFNYEGVESMKGYDPDYPVYDYYEDKGIVIGWKQEKITREMNENYMRNGGYVLEDMGGVVALGGNSNPGTVGIGGSMAQFTISSDHLYTLESRVLTSYDLSGNCPEMKEEVNLNRNCETIFPAKNHLFIGTTTGMLIYSLGNPRQPSFVSEYPHINSCDPVVVQENRAYVTLRTGTACFGNVNELMVVDISNLSSPQNIATYTLTNPHGLGIDGLTLFVCDGSDGLKVYDAQDDLKIDQNRIAHFQNITTYDVIPYNNVLIATAEEGIYQYDYSDPSQIGQLSFIPVK